MEERGQLHALIVLTLGESPTDGHPVTRLGGSQMWSGRYGVATEKLSTLSGIEPWMFCPHPVAIPSVLSRLVWFWYTCITAVLKSTEEFPFQFQDWSQINVFLPAGSTFGTVPIFFYIILRGMSPWANYTDLAAADCRFFADRVWHVVGVTDSYGRILGFLERSRYFFFSSNSSTVLTRLSGPRFRLGTPKIW
jgi:hypothetical protein